MATIEQREAMYRDACETHRRAGYAEGYKAGRKAALREVGCECGAVEGHRSDGKRICGCSISTIKCNRCRLLDEAESGEQEREVGGEG